MFHEAFALGLYDTRWNTDDWDGIYGPRAPPDTHGCVQQLTHADDDTRNDYTVIPGVGSDRCELGASRYNALSVNDRKAIRIARNTQINTCSGALRQPIARLYPSMR